MNHTQKHTRNIQIVDIMCCYDDRYSKPVQIYRGKNAVYKFVDKMLEEVDCYNKITREHLNKPLKMLDKDEQN